MNHPTMNTDFDYIHKTVILGDSGVGKTSILNRFSDGTFSENFMSTIGVDFKIKTIDILNKRVKLQIWDTAGQERFRFLTQGFYRGAQSVVLVFDVTSFSSFESLTSWLKEIERFAVPDINIVLVGNKADRDELREVTKQQAEDFCEKNQIKYLETSAKTADNIGAAFKSVASDWVLNRVAYEDEQKRKDGPVPGFKVGSKKTRSWKQFFSCCITQ